MKLKLVVLVLWVLLLVGCTISNNPRDITGNTPAPTSIAKYDLVVNGNDYVCNSYDWSGKDVVILYGCRGYLGNSITIRGVVSFSVEAIPTPVTAP